MWSIRRRRSGRFASTFALLAVLLLALFTQASPVKAGTCGDSDATRLKWIIWKSIDIQASREKLESMPREQWTDADIEVYLSDALYVLYNGLAYYVDVNRRQPEDPAALARTEYFPVWPANPFNNWKPMRIVDLADGFSAGDMTLQLAPPEFYSGLSEPRPLSFVISIFGPTPEFAVSANQQPLPINTWAVVPDGAVLQNGMYYEDYKSTQKKYAEIVAARKAAGLE